MTRSPLILAALALTLALAGCGNRSVGNKIDDQFIPSEVSSSVARAHNELQALHPPSLLVRSNDSLLPSRIKTQMLADSAVPGTRIKVITENGIVYMLGLVSQAEASHATNLVQSVSGVQKVVKLFEYTN